MAAGARLGPYEIVSPVGAGGMGEVYRARDTKLDRDVAVKVLPDRLAADADALARFEREAKAVAALSHPNILGIFDFGRDGGIAYAAMELLEGENLRDRLAGGGLPQRKAIEYALQIASGLAAAHEKGIVHRDLKPENVFVTRDGRIKILDFGLAKVRVAEAPGTNAPTASIGTEPGVVMGTVGYMSPEQVRGLPADHRSDIFSFGAVLYEMLSGRRAFRGDSAAETMAAIANADPPELSTISAGVSAALDGIVRHCLEKNPGERFQSARDLAFDLQALSASSGLRSGAAAAHGGRSMRLPAITVGAAVLTAVLAVAAAYRLGVGAGDRRAREHPPAFQRLTFRRGTVLNARFSSDGKTAVYCASWQGEAPALYSVRATAPLSQKLDLPSAMLYAVSRSDELLIGTGWHDTIGFTSEATLARATLSGGAPRPVLERVVSADWAPDGQNMAVSRFVGESDVLEYPVGRVLYSTVSWLSDVRVSPDGTRVAFADHSIRGDTAGDVVVVDRAGKLTRLVHGEKFVALLAWSPDGREIWWSGNTTGNTAVLQAVDLSGRRRAVYRSGVNTKLADRSPSGAALLIQSSLRRELSLMTRGSDAERDLSWLDWSFPTDLSADGRRVLISEQGDATKEDYLLYLRPTDGSPGIEVGLGLGATISPDGRFAASVLRDKLMLYPTGVGQPVEIGLPGMKPVWACWFPDGRRLLVSADAPNHPAGLYEKSLDGGAPRPVPAPPLNPYHFRISPDGETVAGVSPDLKLTLVSLRTGVSRAFPDALEVGDVLSWSADGRSIWYQDRNPIPARVRRLDLATGRAEVVREVAPRDRAGVQDVGPVFTTPDGGTVAFSFRRILEDLFLVDGLK